MNYITNFHQSNVDTRFKKNQVEMLTSQLQSTALGITCKVSMGTNHHSMYSYMINAYNNYLNKICAKENENRM